MAVPRAVLTPCFPTRPCRWTAVCVAAPRPAAALPRAPDPANPGPSSRASSTTRLGSSQGPSPVCPADGWGGWEGGGGGHGGGCGSGRPLGSHLLSSSPPPPGTLHPNCHPADPQRPPQRHATLPGHAAVPGTAPLPDAVLLLLFLLLLLLLAARIPGPHHQNYLRAAARGRSIPTSAPRRPVPKPDPDVQAQR